MFGNYFGFCFTVLGAWLAKFAPFPVQPMGIQTKINQNCFGCTRRGFLALGVGYMNFLPVLVGSLHSLHLL